MAHPNASSDVFKAIADPTRRRIIQMLSEHPRTAGELARSFDTCHSTVSEHLAVLRKGSLVNFSESAGRRTYRLQADPLQEVARLSRSWHP